MSKDILLKQGKRAIVDDEYYDWLMKNKWRAAKNYNMYYAQGSKWNKNHKKYRTIIMHRIIMEKHLGRQLSSNEQIDHKNRNGLDNRLCNLRLCDNSQNQFNTNKISKDCHSKYKGVTWYISHNQWEARIQISGISKHLGFFDNEKNAAKQYDYYAIKYQKEFVRLNFPDFDYSNFKPTQLKKKSSRFNGVSWIKRDKIWMSCINIEGKTKRLGSFKNEIDAAQAYNQFVINNKLSRKLNTL